MNQYLLDRAAAELDAQLKAIRLDPLCAEQRRALDDPDEGADMLDDMEARMGVYVAEARALWIDAHAPEANPATRTRCNFYDASDNTWPGYTDGTTWNGWDNVWVTRETLEAISAKWQKEAAGSPDDWAAEEARGLLTMEPDADGLYSLAYGYCMSIADGAP